MTAGEFAKEFGIDYQIVRAATFRTATRTEESWALDYPVHELRQAVREELRYKMDWHRERMDKLAGWMNRLG